MNKGSGSFPKRFLSVLVSVAMVAGGVPTTAIAQEARKKERSERSEAPHVVAQSDEAQDEVPSYQIPNDAEYEPNKVLVSVPQDSTAEAVMGQLANDEVAGIEPVGVSKITDDVIEVELPRGTDLEKTIDRLVESKVTEMAEPNFVVATRDDANEVEVGSSEGSVQVQGEETPVEPTTPGEPVVVEEQGNDTQVVVEEEGSTPSDQANKDQTETDAASHKDVEINPQSAYHSGVQASSLVNDTSVLKQWGLESMYVPEAWKAGIRCNRAVGVAVLDARINTSHPDINDNIAPNSFYNATTDPGNEDLDYGDMSHGSHVAGIIAAEANNGAGIAGVSYNARIIPVQIYGLYSNSCYAEDLIRGIDYVVRNKSTWNIRVINYSSGTYSYSELVKNAWNKAYQAGIAIVAAGGNKATSKLQWPADYPTVVGVTALDNTSSVVNGNTGYFRYPTQVNLAYFSNYNDYREWGLKGKNIAAPGVDIYSHGYTSGDYIMMDGTSMAAPQVSGVLALMFAASPNLSVDKAMALLYASARDLGQWGWDDYYGYGEVNAAYAVYLAKGSGAAGGLGLSPTPSSSIVPNFNRPYAYWSAPRLMVQGDTDSRYWYGDGSYSWSFESSDTSVVQVSKNGSYLNYSAVGTGEALVYAKYNGTVMDAALVNVMGDINGDDSVGVGSTVEWDVSGGEYFAWSWSSDNWGIATVDDSGNVSGVSVGTTTIRATCTANDGSTISRTKTITVRDGQDIWETDVYDLPDEFTYTGRPITPKPRVVDWYTYATLREGVDYRLRYENQTNVGTARVYVDGIGKYYGSYYLTYDIVPATLTATYAGATITRGQWAPTTVLVTGFVGGQSAATAQGYRAPVVSISEGQRNTVGAHSITPYGGSASNYTFVYKAGTLRVNPAYEAPPVVTPHVSYRTHVQRIGWQGYVMDGAMSGTSGRSFRLEGINIRLSDLPCAGGIEYRTHVQRIGWQGWRRDGAMSGTSGRSFRLEAIEIRLYGEMAARYDVYYRVHCQRFGWMGWAKNGERSGSAGYSRRLEGIQILLVPKGQSGPPTTFQGIKQNVWRAFAQKGKK